MNYDTMTIESIRFNRIQFPYNLDFNHGRYDCFRSLSFAASEPLTLIAALLPIRHMPQ